MVAAFFAIPFLTVLAYRGWVKIGRKELPHWRSILGVTSIAITFLGWLSFVIVLASSLIGGRTFLSPLDWEGALAGFVAIGMLFGLALNGASRLQAVAAALLMVALFQGSVVS